MKPHSINIAAKARKAGIKTSTLKYRIKKMGLTTKQALAMPLRFEKSLFRGQLDSINNHCKKWSIPIGRVYRLKQGTELTTLEAMDVVLHHIESKRGQEA